MKSCKNNINISLYFIQKLQTLNDQLINIFSQFLLNLDSLEANYLLEKLIEHDFIKVDAIRNKKSLYFAHHKCKNEINNIIENINTPFKKEIHENIVELSKNEWALHKKYVKEGVNPSAIAKIIRNDEIEKLQEISTQTKFDFNQKIDPSLYEKCSFINKENISLIDYAAFFSAIKCFKYLLMNNANVEKTGKYAIASGNLEIIHLCEQNHSSFEGAYETAIEFHQNDIFHYLYDNEFELNNLEDLIMKSIISQNYEILSFLEEKGLKVNNSMIAYSAESGNIFLLKHFLEGNEMPKDILISAVKSRNIEVVNYVLDQPEIYVNVMYIFLL